MECVSEMEIVPEDGSLEKKTSVELFFFYYLILFFIVLVLSELHDLTPGFDDVKKRLHH